jgi:hypothetical protein
MTATGFIVVGKRDVALPAKHTEYGFEILKMGTAVPDKYDNLLIKSFKTTDANVVTLTMDKNAQTFDSTASITFENGVSVDLAWSTDHYEATDVNAGKAIISHLGSVLNFTIEGITLATKKATKTKAKKSTKAKTEKGE